MGTVHLYHVPKMIYDLGNVDTSERNIQSLPCYYVVEQTT